jgi:hypothetical protein
MALPARELIVSPGSPPVSVLAASSIRMSRFQRYLRFVLARIADHAINRIDELAPWVVADQLRSAV